MERHNLTEQQTSEALQVGVQRSAPAGLLRLCAAYAPVLQRGSASNEKLLLLRDGNQLSIAAA